MILFDQQFGAVRELVWYDAIDAIYRMRWDFAKDGGTHELRGWIDLFAAGDIDPLTRLDLVRSQAAAAFHFADLCIGRKP